MYLSENIKRRFPVDEHHKLYQKHRAKLICTHTSRLLNLFVAQNEMTHAARVRGNEKNICAVDECILDGSCVALSSLLLLKRQWLWKWHAANSRRLKI